MTGKPSIINQYGSVKITDPHFLISWTDELGGTDWEGVALLSWVSVPEMKLELLYPDLAVETLDKLISTVDFYLFHLKNPDPVGYLEYHTRTVSNAYGPVHFTLVDGGITLNKFKYYIRTRSLQLGIHGLPNDLQENLMPIVNYHYLTPLADNDTKRIHKVTVTDYDFHLRLLMRVMKRLNREEGTKLETVNFLHMSRFINDLSLNTYCHMLALLRHFGLIKHKNLGPLLLFYYVNKREIESLAESTSS